MNVELSQKALAFLEARFSFFLNVPELNIEYFD